jgi:hypothetical protein
MSGESKTIFKGRIGEVIRIDKGLIVHGDYFSLCREMAMEIERLRAELAKPQMFVEPITGPG